MNSSKIQLWFRLLTPDTDAFGRIICLVTRDNTYHVEVKADNRFFSAIASEDRVRATDSVEHDDAPAGYWDILEVPATSPDALWFWLQSVTGRGYDFYGCLNAAIDDGRFDPTKYFCSRLARDMATMAGVEGLDVSPSPSLLRQQIKSHLGQPAATASATFPVRGLEMDDADFGYLQTLVDSRKIDGSLAERIIRATAQTQTH